MRNLIAHINNATPVRELSWYEKIYVKLIKFFRDMTNDQAIARINEDHGEHWAEYVRDEIETEEAEYETIG